MRVTLLSFVFLGTVAVGCGSNRRNSDANQDNDARVVADAKVGSDARVGAPDGQMSDGNVPDASIKVPDASIGPKRLFITKLDYDGNLGGISGADAKCQVAANSASLEGSFFAFLSTDQVNAIDRIVGDGPWLSMGGAEIFPNRIAWQTVPFSDAYEYNERNEYELSKYWTGTGAGGTAAGFTCDNWTGTASLGKIGNASKSNAWVEYDTADCGQKYALLCVEQ